MLRASVIVLLCALPLITTVAAAMSDITTLNGVPLVIRVVEVRGTPPQVAARMLARWRSEAPERWTHIQALQRRTVIAQRRGPLHITAVLSPGSRPHATRVLVSVLDLRLRQAQRPAPVAVRGAPSAWLSVTESAPGLTEHLGFARTSLAEARRGWTAALRRAGFVVGSASATQLEARQGEKSVTVFLQAATGGTAVVLQRREVSP